MSWLTYWNRRKLITVSGSSSGAQSDYQMKLTVNQASGTDSTGIVNLGGNVQTTFNDLRFTKSDGTTTLNYWIESITGTTPNQTTTIWIKLAPFPDTIPVSPGTYSFYIYYNNTGATSLSSGVNTFLLFDDFNDNNIDSAKWNVYHIQWGSRTVSSNLLISEESQGIRFSGSSGANYDYGRELASSSNFSNVVFTATRRSFSGGGDRSFAGVSVWADTNNAEVWGGGIGYPGGGNRLVKNGVVGGPANYSDNLGTLDYSSHVFKLVLNGSIVSFYVDGGLVDSITFTGITSFQVGLRDWTRSSTASIDAYLDDAYVRKYISPEPTFSTIGIEELSITAPAATGGAVTTSSGYRIHTFTSGGTFTVNKSMNVEVLLVAGGGAGGGTIGGGGGAGGLIHNSAFAVSLQSYPVTVGAGGIPGTTQDGQNANGNGHNGGNSIFSTLTAIGGGGGGNISAFNGGSGGGGGRSQFKGTGTSGQGNDGGDGGTNDNTAGGGGGAGSVGETGGVSIAGSGGIGLAYSISGSSVYYAGGGGGGVRSGSGRTVGTGGNGGGGAGSAGGIGTVGGANTGGGGGGAGYSGTFYVGASGGSGIVIVRYPTSEDLTPANITATLMTITPSENPCRTGICTATVNVTWTNNGESTGSFVPSIKIDTVPIVVTPPLTPVTVGPSGTVSQQFIISSLITGTHQICPDPN